MRTRRPLRNRDRFVPSRAPHQPRPLANRGILPARRHLQPQIRSLPIDMPDNSFDVVSKIEMPEVHNSVQQAQKEIQQRYDLKDSHSTIEVVEKDSKILLASKDEFKLKAVIDILESKLVKRKVPLKGLQFGEIVPSAGSTVKQEITLQQGIAIEKAREIVKAVKDSKLKVQASIQGDFVRIAGKDRDSLQDVIQLLRANDFGIDMQFTNYRSN